MCFLNFRYYFYFCDSSRFFFINEIFLYDFFLYKLKASLEAYFLTSSYYINHSYILADGLYKVREKSMDTWLIILPDYTFEITLNSKHRTEKLKTKTKDTETRKTKTQCYVPKMGLVYKSLWFIRHNLTLYQFSFRLLTLQFTSHEIMSCDLRHI